MTDWKRWLVLPVLALFVILVWRAFSAYARWMDQSRLAPRSSTETDLLRHPSSTLITSLAAVLFFGSIAVFSAVAEETRRVWWLWAFFAAFACLGIQPMLEFFLARHRISENGIDYRRLSGGRRLLRWSDLRSVRYGRKIKYFRLGFEGGGVAWLSIMLLGLPEAARRIRDNLPASAMDPETRAAVLATADGNPPSLWEP